MTPSRRHNIPFIQCLSGVHIQVHRKLPSLFFLPENHWVASTHTCHPDDQWREWPPGSGTQPSAGWRRSERRATGQEIKGQWVADNQRTNNLSVAQADGRDKQSESDDNEDSKLTHQSCRPCWRWDLLAWNEAFLWTAKAFWITDEPLLALKKFQKILIWGNKFLK